MTLLEIEKQYPKTSEFGIDMLQMCVNNGVYASSKGQYLLQQVENFFNGESLTDKALENHIKAWHNGTLSLGYYVNGNDAVFADYLKSRISVKIFPD